MGVVTMEQQHSMDLSLHYFSLSGTVGGDGCLVGWLVCWLGVAIHLSMTTKKNLFLTFLAVSLILLRIPDSHSGWGPFSAKQDLRLGSIHSRI